MFCENCGNSIDRGHKFCDNCGSVVKRKFFSVHLRKYIKNFNRSRAIVVILLFVGLVLLYYFQRQQQLRDGQLEAQINSVKQQAEEIQQISDSKTKQLNDQLDSEKQQTEDAQKQAKLAQDSLNLVKQQATQRVGGNDLPKVNEQAIVLIACFDALGNIQSGSGTIINAQGYVLTNKHVVTDSNGNALTCGALMNSGGSSPVLLKDTFYNLTVYAPNAGFYNNYDAAVLKIYSAQNTSTKSPVELPASFPYIKPDGGNLKQGDNLYIFGYPGASDLVFNVTRGIVSSFSPDDTYINTDAIIDHGNSGGAAITSDGRFVGIPSQKYIANGDYLGQILRVEDLVIPN